MTLSDASIAEGRSASSDRAGAAPLAAGPVGRRPGRQHIVVIASLTRSLVIFRLELLKAMVAAGHRVTALAPDDDADAARTLAGIGVSFRRIPMARTGTNPIADLRTMASLYRTMRSLSPDILFAYTMKPIIYGGLAARLAGVRRRFAMFTGFGYMFGSEGETVSGSALRWLSVQLYRRALVGASAAFFYNDADGEDIRRHAMLGTGTPMIAISGSGVDLDLYERQPIPPGPPVFLLVARLLREKGILEFAEAARALKTRYPQARFQILGPFYESPLAIGRSDLQRLQTDGAVEYLGETSDVRPYLSASTVFVLPSYYREGIPRSALEALATGRAIVTTDAPGCRETVIDGQNGVLVPPRDAGALAAAMARFLEDPALAVTMGTRSRRLAEERFDVHAINRALLGALEL